MAFNGHVRFFPLENKTALPVDPSYAYSDVRFFGALFRLT
jgi:hypothetical protein